MTNQNNKKRWGRRLAIGIVGIIHTDIFYFVALHNGKGIKWFEVPAMIVMGICLFVGGYLTATDLMKMRNNSS